MHTEKVCWERAGTSNEGHQRSQKPAFWLLHSHKGPRSVLCVGCLFDRKRCENALKHTNQVQFVFHGPLQVRDHGPELVTAPTRQLLNKTKQRMVLYIKLLVYVFCVIECGGLLNDLPCPPSVSAACQSERPSSHVGLGISESFRPHHTVALAGSGGGNSGGGNSGGGNSGGTREDGGYKGGKSLRPAEGGDRWRLRGAPPVDGEGHIQPDVKVIDRFQVVQLLDRGTFGTVFRAWDPKWRQYVALKVRMCVCVFRVVLSLCVCVGLCLRMSASVCVRI